MNWTEKEKLLFKDLKTSERTSIEKYGDFEGRACDPELKQLFGRIRQQEEEHLQTLEQVTGYRGETKTLEQMEGGVIPMMAGGGQQSGQGQSDKCGTAEPHDYGADAHLCADALESEKYISSLYDTAVFEFKDASARDVLNHIQKEEQGHGKQLYDYMAAHQIYC